MDIQIKKIGTSDFWNRYGGPIRTVTKVFFKDGSALTFSEKLSKEEAIRNSFFQKGRDAGMTVEEARKFADEQGKGYGKKDKRND